MGSSSVKVTNPYRTGSAAAAWTYTNYDGIDRVVCTSTSTLTTNPCDSGQPADAKVQHVYAGNQTTTINEAGNERRYTYNGVGKMVKVEEPNPTLATPLVTTYTYEEHDVLKTTNQSGQIRTLLHNSLGQETSEALPESGTTTFTYDNDARLTSATDARGITTTYTYDALGRATGRTYSDSTPSVTFGYDANGFTGLKTSMVDGVGTVNYSYDNMGRVTQEQRVFDQTKAGVTGTFTTGYAYNIKGDLTQMTYPSGRVVNLNYKTGGGCCNSRLESVVDATRNSTIANNISFDALGAPVARTLNPGSATPVTETFSYNHRGQQTLSRSTVSASNVMDFTYGYGTIANVGQLLSRTDSLQPEHSVLYYYDSIYRLSQTVSASAEWSIAWTFDAWSNRLTQTSQGFVATANIVALQTLAYSNNRLTAIQNYTYDTAGNVTNDTQHVYSYNAKNQITQIDGGGAATYLYDGEGRRAKRTVSGVSTFYFYGPGGIISEFTATSGPSGASSSDVAVYRSSDRQGTAVLTIAADGRVIENNRTLPYGESWSIEVASVSTKKFTTYQRDSESNLDYAMNRYYANSYGRFMSKDQGGAKLYRPTMLNRYSYVSADPINHIDPDGNTELVCVTIGNVINCVLSGVPVPTPSTPGGGGGGQTDPGHCNSNGEWEQDFDPRCGNEPGGGGEEGQGIPEHLYLPLNRMGSYGQFNTSQQRDFVVGVMRLVHMAITTRGGCANLLERAGGLTAQQVFMGQSFNYAPNVTGMSDDETAQVLSVARRAGNPAGTFGNKTWVDDEFLGFSPSEAAYVMMHELMHGAGRPRSVVDSEQTRTDIVEKCNFSDPYRRQ